MAILAKAGDFVTTTGTSNVAVTGVGFQPQLVFLMGGTLTTFGGSPSSGVNAWGFGAFTSLTSRIAGASHSTDGASNTSTDKGTYDNSCLTLQTNTGTTDGALDGVSMDADGFTVIPDNAFAASDIVSYLALAGFTNVATGHAMPTGAGSFVVTGLGFQPDCVLFISGQRATINTDGGGGGLGIGWAKSSSEQGHTWVMSRDNIATTNTHTIVTTTKCLATTSQTSDVISNDAAFTSMDADGFTINVTTFVGNQIFGWIALKGGFISIGTTTTRTDTSNQIVATAGNDPVAVIIAGHGGATATQTVPTAPGRLMFGWGTSATARYSLSVFDTDALAVPSDGELHISNTRIVNKRNRTAADTYADAGTMDLVSLGVEQFILDQVDADSANTLLLYLAIGNVSTGGIGHKWAIPRMRGQLAFKRGKEPAKPIPQMSYFGPVVWVAEPEPSGGGGGGDEDSRPKKRGAISSRTVA